MLTLQNALIAIMGDSYERVKDAEKAETLRGRASLVRELIMRMPLDRQAKLQDETLWIHLLQFKKARNESSDRGQWSGRLQEMMKRVQDIVNKEQKASMAHINECLLALKVDQARQTEQLEALVKKLSALSNNETPGL